VSLHFDKTIGPYNWPLASVKWDKEMQVYALNATTYLHARDLQAGVEAWLSDHNVEGMTTLKELVQVNVQSPTAKDQTSGMHNWPDNKQSLDQILSSSWAESLDQYDQWAAELGDLSASQGLRKIWNHHRN
jgi:hypothetical protein